MRVVLVFVFTSIAAVGTFGIVLGASNAGALDRRFVAEAAALNAAQIAQSQVESRSRDSDIGSYARQTITTAARANGSLAAVAQQTGLSAEFERGLAAASPPYAVDDSSYLRQMVTTGEQAIALYEREAQAGTSPVLRAYARQELGRLQTELALARNRSGG